MVAQTFRRPAGIRKKALFLVFLILSYLPVLLSFAGCQFLGMDMFPTTLSREEAVFDLDSKLADLGVTGDFEVRRMQFATSPTTGKSYIFIQTNSFGMNPRLLILDAEDLSVVNATSNTAIVYTLGIDDRGYLVTASMTPPPAQLPTITANFHQLPDLTFITSLGFTNIVPPETRMATTNAYSLFFRYSPDLLQFAYIQAGVIQLETQPSVGLANAQLLSAYYEGSAIRLLFSDYSNNSAYILSYSGLTAFSAAASPLLTDPNATITSIPAGDDNSGWLTRNGAIILTHQNETRLVRYESDSGKELDSFILNDTEDTRFAFSPDGKKWLMYDGVHGKLHLLRTWW